jgi:predicted phage baseplate assembly protein
MSSTSHPTGNNPMASNLNSCDCCEGISTETPLEIYNRPGLSAISYRVGTHALFKESMLTGLSASQQKVLRHFNTRDDDDFIIALLDAWAMTSDVLTFYQERIANESYLRTATERLSLLHLARLIGYELRPGVAANTYLAFTMDETPAAPVPVIPGLALPNVAAPETPVPAGAPGQTVIDIGARAQSVPGPGEQPQIFETIERIEARVEWNAMKPRSTRPYTQTKTINAIIQQGLTTSLAPGDRVLVALSNSDASPSVSRVQSVSADAATNTTRINLDAGTTPPSQEPSPLPAGNIGTIPKTQTLNDQFVRNVILTKSWRQEDLQALATTQKWSLETLATSINKQTAATAKPFSAFALRTRAAIFGHNAPNWNTLPTNLRQGEWGEERAADNTFKNPAFKIIFSPVYGSNWENNTLSTEAGSSAFIHLDGLYPKIVKDTWLALESPQAGASAPFRTTYRVSDNIEVSLSRFTLTAKVSRLQLNTNTNFTQYKLRETTVLAQSEQLELADLPIADAVQGNSVLLDRAYLGLKVGQKVILTGERTDIKGIKASEVMTLSEVLLDGGYTRLSFKESLANQYVRGTVAISGNVAAATHGETKHEVLGSGSAAQPYQRFTLRQPPLTYVSAPTPSGAASTLEVRVNDVRWDEVPTLYGHSPTERIYVTRTDNEGNTSVQFGDGITGARLPTGQENVQATYRRGNGVAGLVDARQISLLLTRPLGVRDVINPLPAEGADDPERLDQVRLNAPLTMLTLDRIVSLKDYEDFARVYAGVAKALATWTWDGQKRGVFVTVAGPEGAEINKSSRLYLNLLAAMKQAGNPVVPLVIKSYQPELFKLAATIRVFPEYRSDLVLEAVHRALRSSFSFEARSFGQPVALSEVIATMQSVEGVLAVNITKLYTSGTTPGSAPPVRLNAALPQAGANADIAPAVLLTLDPTPLTEVVVAS